MPPDLSVVIPAYNRGSELENTLNNLLQALNGIDHEVIIVDDGSFPKLSENVSVPNGLCVAFLLQSNQGSSVARSNGIIATTGKYVFLTDSDDMIEESKLQMHIELMNNEEFVISYSDQGRYTLNQKFEIIERTDDKNINENLSLEILLLESNLHSNNLVFRGDALRRAITEPLIAPDKRYALAGDYWVYYNCLAMNGKVRKVPKTSCFHCKHQSDQLTNHWEALGFSGQVLVEALINQLQSTSNPDSVSKSLSRILFHSWRLLPNGFMKEFSDRKIRAWKSLPVLSKKEYGGRSFQIVASLIGLENTGKLFRKHQRPPYSKVRTITDEELLQSYSEHFPK